MKCHPHSCLRVHMVFSLCVCLCVCIPPFHKDTVHIRLEPTLLQRDCILTPFCSVAKTVIPWTPAHQAPLSFALSQSLLKLMSTELVMPSSHLTLCCPPSPHAFSLSQHQGLFYWVSSYQAKYRSFSFSISPSVNIQSWFPLWITFTRPGF